MNSENNLTPSDSAGEIDSADLQKVQQLAEAYHEITQALSQVIVGQKQVIEELMISLLAGGHCLLVGVPGLAKTLMVRTLADAVDLTFNRIQFTPDLMPADITGTEVIQEDKATGQREFRFLEGPVFANVVLADEINRTPPKTQAALLEAMAEHQVTAGGKRHQLPDPFFVLATQNPIEQEGTYPLPEAQLDRFMFQVLVDYPSEEEEFQIVRQTTAGSPRKIEAVLGLQEILSLREVVMKVPVADHVIRYAMQFSRLTRQGPDAPEFVREYVRHGAGPRASQYLVLAAKARAMLHNRVHVSMEDVQAVAKPVLRHRLITNFTAVSQNVTTDDLVDQLTNLISTDPVESGNRGRLPEIFKSPNAG